MEALRGISASEARKTEEGGGGQVKDRTRGIRPAASRRRAQERRARARAGNRRRQDAEVGTEGDPGHPRRRRRPRAALPGRKHATGGWCPQGRGNAQAKRRKAEQRGPEGRSDPRPQERDGEQRELLVVVARLRRQSKLGRQQKLVSARLRRAQDIVVAEPRG